MALGAHQNTVLRMILKQGMKLVVVGLVLCAAGALALARLMSGLLFGVEATDPITFVGVGLVLAGVAAAATFFPARRATTIDPMIALRAEQWGRGASSWTRTASSNHASLVRPHGTTSYT
jgi:putative ABC transport system permease protein